MDCQHKMAMTATHRLGRPPTKLRPELYGFRHPSRKDCLLVGRTVALALHMIERRCLKGAQIS